MTVELSPVNLFYHFYLWSKSPVYANFHTEPTLTHLDIHSQDNLIKRYQTFLSNKGRRQQLHLSLLCFLANAHGRFFFFFYLTAVMRLEGTRNQGRHVTPLNEMERNSAKLFISWDCVKCKHVNRHTHTHTHTISKCPVLPYLPWLSTTAFQITEAVSECWVTGKH